MPQREELLVSTVPLTLSVERGNEGELRIIAKGFDLIVTTARQHIVIRPERHGVVIERERGRPDDPGKRRD